MVELPWDLAKRGTAQWRGHEVFCVKHTDTRTVLRVPLDAVPQWQSSRGEQYLFAKRYGAHFYQWWRHLAWLLGQTKAQREALTTCAVADMGFVVPEPLLCFAGFSYNYLITRELPGLRNMKQELAGLSMDERRDFWREAGQFSHRMWESGIFHPDFLQKHLCRCDNGAQRTFALIDLDGVTFYPAGQAVPATRRYFNAMQILRSLPPEFGSDADRLAYLEAAFPADWPTQRDAILDAVLAKARRLGTLTHLEHLRG